MNLIERLRKGIVTSAPYEPQYTVPPAKICLEAADALARLTEVAATTDIILMATNETVERLTAENKLLHERHSFANKIFKEQQAALEAARAELALAKEVMAHDRKYIDELLGKLK